MGMLVADGNGFLRRARRLGAPYHGWQICKKAPLVAQGHDFVRRGGALLRPRPGGMRKRASLVAQGHDYVRRGGRLCPPHLCVTHPGLGRTGSSSPTHGCRYRLPFTPPKTFIVTGSGGPGRPALRWLAVPVAMQPALAVGVTRLRAAGGVGPYGG